MAKADDKQDKLHNDKLDHLEKSEIKLSNSVKIAEKKLLDKIIDKFVDNLDTKDGIIQYNSKNITLTQAIDKIIEEFNSTVNADLMKTYVNDISITTEANRKFFATFEKPGIDYKKTTEEVRNKTLDRLGIKSDGKLTKGGFIDSFTNDKRLNLELKELVTKAITGGASLRQMKDELKQFVSGGDGKKGKLTANYNTFIFDTYAQIDRLQTGLYAEALGLKAFRYAGGKIKTTRTFCCQRNNLIFTTEEAEKWASLEFQGKPIPYNPLIDLGGYNCRHTKQFISNIRAAALRDDLKLDEKGNLVKNKSGEKQRLNDC